MKVSVRTEIILQQMTSNCEISNECVYPCIRFTFIKKCYTKAWWWSKGTFTYNSIKHTVVLDSNLTLCWLQINYLQVTTNRCNETDLEVYLFICLHDIPRLRAIPVISRFYNRKKHVLIWRPAEEGLKKKKKKESNSYESQASHDWTKQEWSKVSVLDCDLLQKQMITHVKNKSRKKRPIQRGGGVKRPISALDHLPCFVLTNGATLTSSLTPSVWFRQVL